MHAQESCRWSCASVCNSASKLSMPWSWKDSYVIRMLGSLLRASFLNTCALSSSSAPTFCKSVSDLVTSTHGPTSTSSPAFDIPKLVSSLLIPFRLISWYCDGSGSPLVEFVTSCLLFLPASTAYKNHATQLTYVLCKMFWLCLYLVCMYFV